MILLVGLPTMVVAQGEWENNASVNITKIVIWGEKLVTCWVCHKNPGLQQSLQVQIGTHRITQMVHTIQSWGTTPLLGPMSCLSLILFKMWLIPFLFIKANFVIGIPWWFTVKSLPAMQETWVLSLGWQDPLEKEMATHSSILAWKIPRMEETGGPQSRWLLSSRKPVMLPMPL